MRTWRRRAAPVVAGLLSLILGGVLMQGSLAGLVPWVDGALGVGHFFTPALPDTRPPPILGVPELIILGCAAAVVTLMPSRWLCDSRKVAIVTLLSVAAIITPTPDPFNLLYVWIPLYLLFEFAFMLIRLARSGWRAGMSTPVREER